MLELQDWVANLSADEVRMLELFRDRVREQAFEDVMQVCRSSAIAELMQPKPRLSFRLLRVKSFRLVNIPE